MFVLRLDNSTSPGLVAQVSAKLPRAGFLVGIDWSLIGITGTGQLQATVASTSAVTVPSVIGDQTIISHLATIAPGASSKFSQINAIHFEAGSEVWNSLYAGPTVGGNYCAITLLFEEVAQPQPRDPTSRPQARPRIEDLPGIPELLKGVPELVRFFKRDKSDPLNVFDTGWSKWLGQHVMTLRAAAETFSDVLSDVLSFLEAITVAEDILGRFDPLAPLKRPTLDAKQVWFLTGEWVFKGLQGVADQVNSVGRATGYGTVEGLIRYIPEFKNFRVGVFERFVVLAVLRALAWDSRRESRFGRYVRRTPLLENPEP